MAHRRRNRLEHLELESEHTCSQRGSVVVEREKRRQRRERLAALVLGARQMHARYVADGGRFAIQIRQVFVVALQVQRSPLATSSRTTRRTCDQRVVTFTNFVFQKNEPRTGRARM